MLPSCPPASAEVTKGAAGIVEYSPGHEDGAPLHGTSLTYPQRFYRLNAAVELRFRGNTIWASKGSILKLNCYRTSRTGRPLPAVNLLRGSLKIKSPGDHPAGVITEEGLFDPRLPGELVYTMTRVLTKPGEVTMPQLDQLVRVLPRPAEGHDHGGFRQDGRRDALRRRETRHVSLCPRRPADDHEALRRRLGDLPTVARD